MEKTRYFTNTSIADCGLSIDGVSLLAAEAQMIEYINGLMEAVGRYRAICERAVVMSCMDRLSDMLIDEA